jgi:polysaccharide pyruvyl transferase WcaK-like protein
VRCFLYGYFGYGNFGDDLLLRAVIEGIRRRDPAATFEVHNLNAVAAYAGDPAVRFTGLARLLQGVRRRSWRVLPYLAGFARGIGRSEVLAIGGGTLFIDKGRVNLSLVLLLLAVWYARLRRRRVIVLGVAVDRLDNPVSLWATRRILAAAEFIALRDALSLPYARHVPPERVRLSADLVLGLDVGPVPAGPGRARPVAGLCFIDYFRTVEPSADGHRRYVEAIVGLIERNRGAFDFAGIAFQSGIGQRDDWMFAALRERFPGIPTLRVDSLAAAEEMAHSVDVLVTTRFHLAVLGAMWGKPVVIIDHELKMRAIAEELELPAVTLANFVAGPSPQIGDLLRRSDRERTAGRLRAVRERVALNFAWLDRPRAPASRGT